MSTTAAHMTGAPERPLYRTRLGWATDWRGRLSWALVDSGRALLQLAHRINPGEIRGGAR